jgi:hypothetical protein
MPLSFQSGAALVDRIEQLRDPGTHWKTLDIAPNSGTPIGPVKLYFRDPIEAIQSLLHQPQLKDDLEFVPRKVWTDETCSSRVFNEIFTGKWAWKTQVSQLLLPTDASC